MRKNLLISLLILLAIGVVQAQDQENRFAEITNPKLIHINKNEEDLNLK